MKKTIIALCLVSIFAIGCTRIETGEVGLRRGFDKQISKQELLPGSFNQHLIGDVMLFPIKQIGLQLNDIKPQTLDNSTLADVDLTVVYNINPSSVGEIYTTESQSFHATNEHGETYLMYNYLTTVANSAVFKAVNKYPAIGIASNRGAIETDIAKFMTEALTTKNLNMHITIAQVQVKNILPDPSIIASANAVITQQNALKSKAIEVEIAQKESQRLTMLSSNHQNIEYLNATSLALIAQGVHDGKVQSIVIPYNFNGLLNLNK
jgi:regulator of protease activity HflC (stomatin/prohibitin superfamily)